VSELKQQHGPAATVLLAHLPQLAVQELPQPADQLVALDQGPDVLLGGPRRSGVKLRRATGVRIARLLGPELGRRVVRSLARGSDRRRSCRRALVVAG